MGVTAVSVEGAAFWERFVEVCTAAMGVGAGRRAVAGLLGSAGAAVPSEVSERLSKLVRPLAAEADKDNAWLGLMVRAGKVGEAELRAAREIVFALQLRTEACAGAVPAVDPTRLVVDGGPNPGQRIYGVACTPEMDRYDRWVEQVKALPEKSRVLRGRNDNLSLLVLVQKVLVGGVGPNTLDKTLGVRNGRCGDAVVRELRRYADCHFRY